MKNLVTVLGTIAILLGYLLPSPALFAQSKHSNKPYEQIRRIKNANGIKSTIEFWDSTHNNKIKDVNLISENPYSKLSLKIVDYDGDYLTPVYRCNNPPYQETDTPMPTFFHNLPKDTNTYYISSYFHSTYNTQKSIAVIYVLGASRAGHQLVYNESTIYVYNNRGQLIYNKSNLPIDCGEAVVTDDGRYCLITTGVDYGEGIVSKVPQGYIICDMEKSEVIVSNNNRALLSPFSISGSLFCIGNELTPGHVEYSIYDLYHNKYYSRIFSHEESPNIKKFDQDGILIYAEDKGEMHKILYKENFTIKNIIDK